MGHSKGSVTSKYIHTLDTALVMAADTIAGYIHGLLDGVEFKQTAYALDRSSRTAAHALHNATLALCLTMKPTQCAAMASLSAQSISR